MNRRRGISHLFVLGVVTFNLVGCATESQRRRRHLRKRVTLGTAAPW
jgi:hypothetical protein